MSGIVTIVVHFLSNLKDHGFRLAKPMVGRLAIAASMIACCEACK
jgi:hypothetical protein